MVVMTIFFTGFGCAAAAAMVIKSTERYEKTPSGLLGEKCDFAPMRWSIGIGLRENETYFLVGFDSFRY